MVFLFLFLVANETWRAIILRIFHLHPAFLSCLTAGKGTTTTTSSLAICSPAAATFLVTASLVPDVAPSSLSLVHLSKRRSILYLNRAARRLSGEEWSAMAAQSSQCPRFTATSAGSDSWTGDFSTVFVECSAFMQGERVIKKVCWK